MLALGRRKGNGDDSGITWVGADSIDDAIASTILGIGWGCGHSAQRDIYSGSEYSVVFVMLHFPYVTSSAILGSNIATDERGDRSA